MSEHEKLKRAELADGVGYAIDALITRAEQAGELIWTHRAVQLLQAEMPDTEITAAELAKAVMSRAAARGVAIVLQEVD